jgi:hypothetical protein
MATLVSFSLVVPMSDLIAPDLAVGALALAAAVLYAAWHEYDAKNQRDAKLLAAVGAISLMGGALAWLP